MSKATPMRVATAPAAAADGGLAQWGGKGFNLFRLAKKGLPVPTTLAFSAHTIEHWLKTLPGYDQAENAWRAWPSVERRVPKELKAFQATILAAAPPAAWDVTLKELGKRLRPSLTADEKIILRSSMSCEDDFTASFAGCFRSEIASFADSPAIWVKLKAVVASAFDESALLAVRDSGPARPLTGIAVVVQPWIQPELAGVCFSRHPHQVWDADSGLVEWVSGAGEALVSGNVQPDSVALGGEVPSALADFWRDLWRYARAVEKSFGQAVDLEWVWDGRKLWIVQARPVATDEARLGRFVSTRRGYSREQTLERFPTRMTRLGWDFVKDVLCRTFEDLDERIGLKIGQLDAIFLCHEGFIYGADNLRKVQGASVRWLKLCPPWSAKPWLILKLLLLCGFYRLFARNRSLAAPLLKLGMLEILTGQAAKDVSATWGATVEGSCREVRALTAAIRANPPADGPGILGAMAAVRETAGKFFAPDALIYLTKDHSFKLITELWKRLGLDELMLTDLVRSFPGNLTLAMSADWTELLRVLRVDPAQSAFIAALTEAKDDKAIAASVSLLLPDSQSAWQDFMKRHGHTCPTWEVSEFSWSERPAQIVPLLKSGLAAAANEGPAAGRALADSGRTALFSLLAAQGWGGPFVKLARRAIERLETFMRIDEEQHFWAGAFLQPSRLLVKSAGALLAERGLLDQAEDIYFLSSAELTDALAGPSQAGGYAAMASGRRRVAERTASRPVPWNLPAAASSAGVGCDAAPSRVFEGLSMSRGVCEGIAVVAPSSDEIADLPEGAILITPTPNPLLTPLYRSLSGLVTITGGLLSHGFVAAREFGLPAVSGIGAAMSAIPHGARIRVDGNTGKVTLLDLAVGAV